MIGIILAGGKGTRLGELTRVTNKCVLPLGDAPMIYHSIKKMVHSGINEILIVTGTEHMGGFVELLGSGKRFGCNFTYKVQDEALGIAHALSLWSGICREKCVVILGDNVFEDDLDDFVHLSAIHPYRAFVGITAVDNPTAFGNIEFNKDCSIKQIVEKPKVALSSHIVTGLYSYPSDVFDVIKTLKPSARGEYEITDVNNHYLGLGKLDCYRLQGWWIDAGTVENYHKANRKF
jgi:glucose-1-phosphate thymidylyltransferase